MTGNSGTFALTNFMGTTDATDVIYKSNNTEHIRITSGGMVVYNVPNPMYRLQGDDPAGPDSDICARVYNTGNLGFYPSFQIQAIAVT